jgi:hypothetical protein
MLIILLLHFVNSIRFGLRVSILINHGCLLKIEHGVLDLVTVSLLRARPLVPLASASLSDGGLRGPLVLRLEERQPFTLEG